MLEVIKKDVPVQIAIQKGIREGNLDLESNDLEKLVGRPATPHNVVIRQMLG